MIRSLRPEVQRFIDEQVKSGRFPTPEAVVEAAILDWQDLAGFDLDDETAAAINEALDAFRAHISKRFSVDR